MLTAAQEAAGDGVSLLGVTVLTSLDEVGLGNVWGRPIGSIEDEVLRLAELAEACDLGGVVCSAREASSVRSILGSTREIVTPGIRLAGDSAHDQRRVTTPAQAVAAGATRLVVGRSISGSSDPQAAFDRVLADANAGIAGRT